MFEKNRKQDIKPLWKKFYIRLEKNKDDEEYHKSIFDIDEIDDDIYKWLNLSVKQRETNFNAPFFIEYLLKHVAKIPDKVANLYIKMFNKGFYPDFKKDHIIEIITKLNSNNLKEKAVNICNLYLNKGFEFTWPILEEIQNNEKTK